MPNYVRAYLPGGSFLFTVVTHQRRRLFSNEAAVDVIRDVVQEVRKGLPFTVDAWVLLPNHIHAVWTLPEGDTNFSKRWGLIKATFTKRAVAVGMVTTGEPIWQPRFWEHRIRDERDFAAHIEYVYINPVKHGLAASVVDWPWSSFHRDVKRGLFPANWGSGIDVDESRQYGEPTDQQSGHCPP